MLSANATVDNAFLDGTADSFITNCESQSTYPWRYYYVKYSAFRPGSFGKLSNSKSTEKPYLFSVMQTKSQWSQNTYMPYLFVADKDHISRDDMGQRLSYEDRFIICENSAFVVNDISGNEIERISVPQNADGIDTEDRIDVLKKYLTK